MGEEELTEQRPRKGGQAETSRKIGFFCPSEDTRVLWKSISFDGGIKWNSDHIMFLPFGIFVFVFDLFSKMSFHLPERQRMSDSVF